MSKLKTILGPMRLPFLTLPPVCVLLGVSVSIWTQGSVNIYYVLLALVGAIASHISVNSFNEYFDFKSGLDSKTERTPFSGGSGTLQAHSDMASSALITALVSFCITGLIGLYFLYVRGLGLLPLGLLGLVIVYTYTPWLTRNPLLCLLAPGLGFGTLWVLGTSFVLSGAYTWSAFIVSLVPFFLVSNLLLLNQFPDTSADQSIGRRNYPIVLGKKASSYIFGLFLLLTYLSVMVGVVLNLLPWTALLGLLTLLIGIPAVRGAYLHAENTPNLIPFMGMNVLINLLTPALVAIGIFLGRI